MNESQKRLLLGSATFVVVFAVFVGGYVLLFKPFADKRAKVKAEQEHKQIIEATSTQTHFDHEITIVVDGFSGYSIYRDPMFHSTLAAKKIKANIVDDGANYNERAKKLQTGEYQMSVYTIDAMQTSFADLGDSPATIVAITDETTGADAMVAAGAIFPNIDALNDPDVKIVCTRNSPSETLARVVMRYYNLPQLSKNPFVYVDGAKAVYESYKDSKPGEKKVFVLWEPYVSKMTANPDYHSVMTSDKFRGYIADVLLAQRGYLHKNENIVTEVVKAYFTTLHHHKNAFAKLLLDDSNRIGEPLKKEQAEKLANALWMKNTQENYAHFRFVSGNGIQSIDEIIRNITDVLIQTGAIGVDPTGGVPGKLYYDNILRRMYNDGWHPGFAVENIRDQKALADLSDEEWETLKPVGTLNIPRLVFARGTSTVTARSEETLKELSDKLRTWPQYYLIVQGNSAKSDDPKVSAANKQLAKDRAESAVDWLVKNGVDRKRIRAESGKTNGSTTVVFVLGEMPY